MDLPLTEFGSSGCLDRAATPRKRRLAIVSTYDELCGIAAFTRSLVRIIEDDFDLEVFDLDQFLLRQTDRRSRRKADGYFRAICARLGEFDIVNLQLEFGILGGTRRDSLRRLRWLCEAARQFTVTFHTVPRRQPIDWEDVFGNFRRLRIVDAIDVIGRSLWWRRMTNQVFSILHATADRNSVRLIVHTRRDRRYLQIVAGFDRVFDHPLSHLRPQDVAEISARAGRGAFPELAGIPAEAKLIGVFGFLSPYKGFETAIRAMRHLPDDHHLLIFGGVHPHSIVAGQKMAPYVRQLLRELAVDRTLVDRLANKSDRIDIGEDDGEPSRLGSLNLSVDSEGSAKLLVEALSDSLANRVHFMGALSDEQFWIGMATCDVVVLPYREVGQSSSGSASQAIELGCRTVLSRTQGFLQLGRYYPNRLEYFDIGNHLELASRLRAEGPARPYPPQAIGPETLRKIYVAAHAESVAHTDPMAIEGMLPTPPPAGVRPVDFST